MLVKSWNNHNIRWREDGYGCLTDMAKATNKHVGHWIVNKKTTEYINELSSVIGKPTTEILQVIQGGEPEKQGTWGCKQLCIRFAQWCNAKFAVQVDLWVEEIMTNGVVDIRNLTPTEILHATTGRLVEIEREQKQLQENVERIEVVQIEHTQKITNIKDKVATVEAELNRVVNPDGYYYTIMGYNQRYHRQRRLSRQLATNLGRMATRLCREANVQIQQVNDVRFGAVNSYPEDILQRVFNN